MSLIAKFQCVQNLVCKILQLLEHQFCYVDQNVSHFFWSKVRALWRCKARLRGWLDFKWAKQKRDLWWNILTCFLSNSKWAHQLDKTTFKRHKVTYITSLIGWSVGLSSTRFRNRLNLDWCRHRKTKLSIVMNRPLKKFTEAKTTVTWSAHYCILDRI